jgi:type II secretory pathway predicted ATPase ExeA
MYKDFYKLTSNPFGISPDPRYLYGTSSTREALACLEYGISARKGFIVLTGEVGTGKTTLLRRALDSLKKETIHTSFVFNPRLDVLDFLEFILTDFGVPPIVRTKSGMLIQLNKWLIERFSLGEICVLVIDEAQNLTFEMLEEIRLLTNLETASEKLLQIVLSGQPELEDKLRAPSVRQLRQRIPLWPHTYPLDEKDTAAYIAHRLLVAGTSKQIFSTNSIRVIHHYSQGIPRIINLICEHALIFGFVQRSEFIDEEITFDVAHDLALITTSLDDIPTSEKSSKNENLQDTSLAKSGTQQPGEPERLS